MKLGIAGIAGIFALFVIGMLGGCPNEYVCPDHTLSCTIDEVIGPMPDEMTSEAKESDGGKVCANLRTLKCSDAYTPQSSTKDGKDAGVGRSCTATVNKAIKDGITAVPVSCLVIAKTKDEARRCGFVSCH